MAAERAQPSDLDHAQQRLAGLGAELCATLEETLRLTTSGEHEAAVIRLDDQSRSLDAAMDALARDIAGIALAPPPPRRRHLARWVAAAVVAVVAGATGALVLSADPLASLTAQIERADRTSDPQARLLIIEDAYASLRRAPADVVAASSVPRKLADAARRTAALLDDSGAPEPMRQRAAIIVRGLDPVAPVPPQSGAGSPTEPIRRTIPGG